MKIDDLIDKLSRDIWNKINLSNQFKSIYGEETITDTTLLEILCLNSPNIRVIPTPKLKESQQGSDWEWYIGSNKYGWIRYAIQAKKSNPNTKKGNYESINHFVNNSRQIDILRTYSDANNSVPLYCFYNYQPNSNQNHWKCNKNFDQELLGWTICPLENIELALSTRGGKNFDFIHSLINTKPTKCLFECPHIISAYKDNNFELINNSFKSNVNVIEELPSFLYNQKQNINIESFPDKFYNKNVGLYPSKIAVITLNDNNSD